MDYAFLGPTGQRVRADEAVWATVLAIVHVGTGFGYGLAVQRKGMDAVDNRPKYVVEAITTFLDYLCLGKIVLQTDNEPSILEVAKEVKKARQPLETLLRSTPVHSSSSNGAV